MNKTIGEHIQFVLRRNEFELLRALERANRHREFDIHVNSHATRLEVELELNRVALQEVKELYQ